MPFSDEQFAETASCFKLAFRGSNRSSNKNQFNPELAFEQAIEWAQKPTNFLLTPHSPFYPASLLHLSDHPQVLFVKGNPQALQLPSVAVVGSRRASPQGEKIALEFSKVFALAGLSVVSGLAMGIDAAAHRGALAAAQTECATIGVVGHGIELIYPQSNKALKEQIQLNGCVISELPLYAPPLPANFPRRNRLIAALSKGVWVVEAALKSGSLITARLALDLGREVFATPGSIFSDQSKGCNWLLRQGAKFAECPQDILDELLEPYSAATGKSTKLPYNVLQSNLPFDSDNLKLLGWSSWWPDQLAAHLHVSSAELSVLLLQWELQGHVARQTDGQICRV
jgi:DNA processing protein